MAMITSKNVRETDVHQFTAEASDLGWPAGHFPRTLTTDLGNGQPFTLTRVDDGHGTHHYAQTFGCITLVVFND